MKTTKTILNSDLIIREARKATIAFIKDRTGSEQNRLTTYLQNTGRESQDGSTNARLADKTHDQSSLRILLEPRVDGMVSFVYYNCMADQKRKMGNHLDAIKIYQIVGNGLENGALNQYVTDPALLRRIATHKSEIVMSIDPIYVTSRGNTSSDGVLWKAEYPLTAIQPYYPFVGQGRSLLACGYNALAAEEYYAAIGIHNLNAPAYEGVADALIGNTDRSNTKLEAIITSNSDLAAKPQILQVAVLKYQGAFELLNYMIETDQLEQYLQHIKTQEKQALNKDEQNALLRIEMLFERRDRYAQKTQSAKAML